MSPKEKALEIFDKCYYKIEDATAGLFENDVDYLTARRKSAQWCSIIAVDEMLEYTKEPVFPMGGATGYDYDSYLEEVKAEIERL